MSSQTTNSTLAVQPKPTSKRFKDIEGQRYGRLVVIGHLGVVKGNRHWLCQCDCGELRSTQISALKSGKTQSCGCMAREMTSERSVTHGMTMSPEFNVWCSMKKRCNNPSHKSYKDYGGRGIRVCERWLNSFENFLSDVGERPSPKHSLDRFPDQNGNYEPDNVRWATIKEQQRNRRSNTLLTFNGVTLTIIEWSERTGLSKGCISMRIGYGWSVDKILTKPSKMKVGSTSRWLMALQSS